MKRHCSAAPLLFPQNGVHPTRQHPTPDTRRDMCIHTPHVVVVGCLTMPLLSHQMAYIAGHTRFQRTAPGTWRLAPGAWSQPLYTAQAHTIDGCVYLSCNHMMRVVTPRTKPLWPTAALHLTTA